MGAALRRTLIQPPQFLINRILPSQEVHLLAGTSDAGKTRWLFHMLQEWEKGTPILGLKSTPVPWVYVAADRTERTAKRTMEDMNIDPASIPLIPAFGKHHKTKRQIIDEVARRGAQLAVIEGFQKFCDSPALGKQVTDYLEEMSAYTEVSNEFPMGLTIVGVVESPKLKPQERYQDARQRVSGVSAWGFYSGTVLLIERQNPQDSEDPRRTLYVCAKMGTRLTVNGAFDKTGHLTFSLEDPGNLNTYASVTPKPFVLRPDQSKPS